jgi:hypothetical protein
MMMKLEREMVHKFSKRMFLWFNLFLKNYTFLKQYMSISSLLLILTWKGLKGYELVGKCHNKVVENARL